MSSDNTDIISLHARIAELEETAGDLLTALRSILGSQPTKFGYLAASNVLDDEIRGRAWVAVDEATSVMGRT